jgi:hypothetical protein
LIDEAIGVLIAEQWYAAGDAIAVLPRASRQQNVKVPAIVAAIVEVVTGI